MYTVSGKKICDLSNNFFQFCISNFVINREKPTHTKIRVSLDFVQTNLTTLYCYLIGIPWLLILRMIQRSYFLPFTIKLIRLLKSMYHWHHKHVKDHTLEPSCALHKSWDVGKTYCSFSLDWLISIYDLFHISFHHSNWLTVALLSQQILTVLSAFCCHSWASPTWPVGFLYDPMFFEFVPLILYLLFQCIGNSRRFLKCELCIASHDNMGLKALHTSQ